MIGSMTKPVCTYNGSSSYKYLTPRNMSKLSFLVKAKGTEKEMESNLGLARQENKFFANFFLLNSK